MSKREKLSITLDPEIKKQILTYAKVNGTRSISYHIEQAVKMYLNQDDQILAKQIENSIKYNIKAFEDRYCRILAKVTKRTYANTKILLNMFAYMSNSELDTKFLLDTLYEAERDGYRALKNGIIERDIDDLFSKEELIKKAYKDK
ncbi:MAG: ribbon-helix-helix protein, CopG family [Clostridia bacterium]|nr:ribbon-helix-helix protein, CopG family [Clostridia bacterium]